MAACSDRRAHQRAGIGTWMQLVLAVDGLPPGLTRQHAADLCWAHMAPYLYRCLVTQRGWTTSDYTEWLSGSLAATLLPAS